MRGCEERRPIDTLDPYYRWIYRLFMPYLGRRVLDAGCGRGAFSSILAETAEYVLAVDADPVQIDVLRERFDSMVRVEVRQVDLRDSLEHLCSRRFDTIACLDVLEHLEDDVRVLGNLLELIQPGGHLLVKVPAGPWLFGSVDVASGHCRRYSLQPLAEKVQRVGWELARARHMNLFGVLPYWWRSRAVKRPGTFAETFRPWQMWCIRRIIPGLECIDRIVIPPFGLSVILVARRPGLGAGLKVEECPWDSRATLRDPTTARKDVHG